MEGLGKPQRRFAPGPRHFEFSPDCGAVRAEVHPLPVDPQVWAACCDCGSLRDRSLTMCSLLCVAIAWVTDKMSDTLWRKNLSNRNSASGLICLRGCRSRPGIGFTMGSGSYLTKGKMPRILKFRKSVRLRCGLNLQRSPECNRAIQSQTRFRLL